MPERSQGPEQASQRGPEDDQETVESEPSIGEIIARLAARSETEITPAEEAQGSSPFARSRFRSFRLKRDQAGLLLAFADLRHRSR